MSANQNQSAMSGIGGWLILVAIGLCLTPLRIGAEIIQGVRSLAPVAWRVVTTPGSPAYHPLFGPLIVGEMVANAALLVWALVLLYLFFTKRRAFPRAMIAFLIVRVAIQMADIFVARSSRSRRPPSAPVSTVRSRGTSSSSSCGCRTS